MMLNSYRYAVAVAATTVYAEEDFTATTTGDLTTNNLATDELGLGWRQNNGTWSYAADASGVQETSGGGSAQAAVETNGREDVQFTVEMTINRGSANFTWQGVILRSTTGNRGQGIVGRFTGAATTPVFEIYAAYSTLIKSWNLGTLMVTRPVSGDTIIVVMRCNGNDITLWSIGVNGAAAEIINDTVTLTGANATNYGAGSGADWYGVFSEERVASSVERFKNFKVESIP